MRKWKLRGFGLIGLKGKQDRTLKGEMFEISIRELTKLLLKTMAGQNLKIFINFII